MKFRQFYLCMCRNRRVSFPAGCFAGRSRLRIRICRSELRMGENACVLFARYGEGWTEVVGLIFSGNNRILGLLRFLSKDGDEIIV